jgi:F0F1-type ATP synthase assembly protein I
MLPIELFGWILSTLLTIGFISSLVVISRRPRLLSQSKHKRSSQMNNDKGKNKQFN